MNSPVQHRVLLQASGINKAFPPAVQALIDASLELRAGEVHALVGENGAGKSTLSRIIAGLLRPDTGMLLLNQQPFAPTSRRDAEQRGVRIVLQELNLVSTLTVAESIFIDRLPNRFGWINRRKLVADAAGLLAQIGLDRVSPHALIGSLGIGQQQLVEIAAGLSSRCEVLILDEPTAALTDAEVDLLFQQIARLKSGGVAILYISHRMEEIARIADRITILRDGHVVASAEKTSLSTGEIIRLMVGRDLATPSVRPPRKSSDAVLRVRNLRASPAVCDVSFDLLRGEILGFAGLMGSGRTETVRAIFGADRKDGGIVELHGQAAEIRSPRDAIQAGVALLTEDRKAEGLLLPLAIRENISLTRMTRVSRRFGIIQRQRERAATEALAGRLRVRCSSVDQRVSELSGGNQQKVVIAKWLHRDCDIFIFDEPTRGIDVGAKFEIYQLLAELADRGKALLVISSELPELFSICDRIAVLSAGVLVKIFDRDEFNQDAIMTAALTNY